MSASAVILVRITVMMVTPEVRISYVVFVYDIDGNLV